ncbi:Rhs family protein [Opitutaceae bacterium TAV1]|nr:Rhs family protein [Opitutaceae bacterium TAV1]
MGPVPAAPEFGLSLQLVHDAAKIKTTEHAQYTRRNLMRKQAGVALLPPKEPLKKGETDPKTTIYRSDWSIPQLVSYLFPANRDRLVWQPPGGGQVEFLRDDMEATPPRFSPEGWHCKEIAAGHYRLTDREGWVWDYQNGLPATLTAPSGRQLEFFHDKGLLVRVLQYLSAAEKGTRKEVLRVTWNDQRKPVRLVSDLMEHRLTYDKDTGHLIRWDSTFFTLASNAAAERKSVNETRPESDPVINLEAGSPALAENGNAMGAMHFRYVEDVLAVIRYPGGRTERFRWEIEKGRLLDDGLATYEHSGAERSGYTLSRTDRAGRKTTVRHDYAKSTLTTTYPDGSREVTAYQRRAAGRGLLRERTGRDGQVTYRVDYNTRHLPVRIRELGKAEIRQVYDDRDRLVEIWRAPMGALPGSEFGVSGSGLSASGSPATSATASNPKPETLNAKPDGEAVAVAGQLVRRLLYTGASRKPSAILNAAGNRTQMEYDERNQLVRLVAEGGAETTFRYDVWGRMVYRKTPAGFIEQVKYDDEGRPVEQRREDGRIATTRYDKAGRLLQRTEAGIVYSYRYDNAGRPLEVQRNHQPWGKWAYLAEALTLPEPKKAPSTWKPAPASVFLQGVSFTDSRGHTTKRYYDAEGRLALVIDPLNQWTIYRYNAVNEVTGWIDPRGNALWLERDAMGRIVRQDNALGQTLRWTYDSAGRLATRANGEQTARYTYDAAGRLTAIDYGRGQVVTYERDGLGRLVSARTAEITTRYTYDALDRVTRVEQHPRNGPPSGVAWTWTPHGQKAAITVLSVNPSDPSGLLKPGSTTVNRYDAIGRLTGIELDGTLTARYVYSQAAPRLELKALGNGLSYRYAYDDFGRMAALEILSQNGSLRQRLRYVWDEHGMLARRVLERPAPAPVSIVGVSVAKPAPAALLLPSSGDDGNASNNRPAAAPVVVEINYDYDALGRLVTACSPQDARQNRRYRYDGAGNLVENRSPSQWLQMEYDAANQLVRKAGFPGGADAADAPSGAPASVTQFRYDRAGRMTQEIEGDQAVRSFSYGYLDKVMTVQRPDGRAAAYAYDAAGMLVGKATRPDAGAAPQTEWWVWDGLALVRRGDEIFVNEPHPAGGMTLMSRTPGDDPAPAAGIGRASVADASAIADPTPRPAAGAVEERL